MVTNYERGRTFEYRTKHDLEDRGYYCVRAAGSHSKVDIAAFKGDICLLVQCKTDGKISPLERRILSSVSTNPQSLPIVASKTKGHLQYHVLENDKRLPFDPGEKLVL